MVRVLDVQEMAGYIQELKRGMARGAATATLEVAVLAEGLAKKNAQKQFTGTAQRPKSGNLMSRIFSGFADPGEASGFARGITIQSDIEVPRAFVGVRESPGKRYAAAFEFGPTTIKPKTAKHLWIPLFGPKSPGMKSMTPRAFIELMHQGKAAIFRSKQGNLLAFLKGAGGRAGRDKSGRFLKRGTKVADALTPLFLLKDSVTLPAKPFVQPAVDQAVASWPALLDKRIMENLKEI